MRSTRTAEPRDCSSSCPGPGRWHRFKPVLETARCSTARPTSSPHPGSPSTTDRADTTHGGHGRVGLTWTDQSFTPRTKSVKNAKPWCNTRHESCVRHDNRGFSCSTHRSRSARQPRGRSSTVWQPPSASSSEKLPASGRAISLLPVPNDDSARFIGRSLAPFSRHTWRRFRSSRATDQTLRRTDAGPPRSRSVRDVHPARWGDPRAG